MGQCWLHEKMVLTVVDLYIFCFSRCNGCQNKIEKACFCGETITFVCLNCNKMINIVNEN